MRRLAPALLALAWLGAAWAHPRLPPNPPPVKLSAAHWTTIQLPATPLGIAAQGNNLWVCGWDGMIAESADGGRTWRIRHFKKDGGLVFALAFASPDYVYAFGGAKMALASADGGATWRRWPGPGFAVNEAYFGDRGHGLLAGPEGFALGGPQEWRPRRVSRSGGLVSAALSDDNNAVVLWGWHLRRLSKREDTAGGALWWTADGGRRWRHAMLRGLRPLGAAVVNGRYLVVAERPDNKPVVLASSGGARWYRVHGVKRTGHDCNAQGCRAGGWRPFSRPAAFIQPWVYPAPADPDVYAAWAAAPGVVCDVGNTLRCALTGPARQSKTAPAEAPQARKPPQCVYCYSPGYPPAAMWNGVRGDVTFRALVAQSGKISDLVLCSAPSPVLARAALIAVSGWDYRPAMLNGRPVATRVQITIRFRPRSPFER